MATVQLEHLEPANDGPFTKVRWRLLEDVGYEVPTGLGLQPGLRVAPVHLVGSSTDLASVPPWLWGVIASFGRHTLAALLHDRLCEEAEAAGEPAFTELRREADQLFRQSMRDLRVPWPRRWIMWAAVRIFGEAGRSGLVAALPAATVLAVTLAVWIALFTGLLGPLPLATTIAVVATGVALLVAVVAVAIGRRDLAGAILVGVIGGVLVAPALLVSLATVLVLDGPPLLVWGARRVLSRIPASPVNDPGSPPGLGPMGMP